MVRFCKLLFFGYEPLHVSACALYKKSSQIFSPRLLMPSPMSITSCMMASIPNENTLEAEAL
jgi:hypothetical protein